MTRDYLDEAARIISGRSLMIAQREHLEAVAQLVREAYSVLNDQDSDVDLRDWTKRARLLTDTR